MNISPLISIIVPVYNVEKYIKKCIDSIISQSYKKYELIIVDDGSTDNSRQIIDSYNDERIKVISQKNKGLSGARNTALKHITGEYVMFVDGDDWLDENCLLECVARIDDDTDIIIFPFKKEDDKKTTDVRIFASDKVFNAKEVKGKLLRKLFGQYGDELKHPEKMDNMSTAWGKLYKTKIVDGYSFEDTKKIGVEDNLANIYYFSKAKKVKYTNSTYYHYRRNNTVSLTRSYNEDLFCRLKNQYAKMESFINENGLNEECRIALNNRIIINLLACSNNVSNSNLDKKTKIKEIKKISNDNIVKNGFKKFDSTFLTPFWKVYYRAFEKNRAGIVLFMNQMMQKYKTIRWGRK